MAVAGQGPSAGRVAQKSRTRQRLMAAALAVGEGATVEDVAAAAEVSRATAYRYFPSQNALLKELTLVRTLQSVDGPVDDVHRICATTPDHVQRVEAVVRRMAAWSFAEQDRLRVTLRLSLETDDSGDPNYRRPGYRGEWIALMLAPLEPELTPQVAERLRRSLYPLFGLDPLLSLVDLLGLDTPTCLDVLGSTARALVQAALEDSSTAGRANRASVPVAI